MENSIIIEKVYERDIDLLVMRLLSTESSVLEYFCSKMKITDYKLQEIAHSVSDGLGESDIVITLNCDGARHLLMIENKIDAQAQKEQCDRYTRRGERQLKEGLIKGFSVCIMAPAEYIEENTEAKKYVFKITYEELLGLDAIKNEPFASAMLMKAIEKQKSQGEINLAVSVFWQNYYEYQKIHYPDLILNYSSAQKGPNANWPSFKIDIPSTKIIHKSAQGWVDLEFSGKAAIQPELAKQILPFIDDDMKWHETGKSASLGIKVEQIDFKNNFEDYKESIDSVFEAVSRLHALAEKLYNEGLIPR